MKYDDLTIQKLRELSILDVADKLGFKLKGLGDEGRRAICPYHDDKHPSLHFSKKKGIFKCFVCGAKGDLFKLVMDDRNCTFPEACQWLIKEFNIVVVEDCPTARKERKETSPSVTATRSQISDISFISAGQNSSANPSIPKSVIPLNAELVTKSLSLNSAFCKSVVAAGYLSESQLRHAAARYRLGCTKDGGVIFWEIDDQQRVHTGKIMYYQSDCHRDKQHPPTWVHSLMKDKLPAGYELQHCLFGLHLISNTDNSDLSDKQFSNWLSPSGHRAEPSQILDKNSSVPSVKSVVKNNSVVCIVESEKTAVIMSVICPKCLWLSCGGLQMFKPELLAPLVNHKVVIFPDTDETGEAFNSWLSVLQQAQKLYPFKYPLRISRLLEDKASPDQKSRKIDLADFLFKTHTELLEQREQSQIHLSYVES